MKTLVMILALIAFSGCQKEEGEPVNIINPQTVVYSIYSRTGATKRIRCELYAVKEKTREKGQFVGYLDTVVTGNGKFTFRMIQNVRPVMYCIASLRVDMLSGGFDTLALEIGNEKHFSIRRSQSCATHDYYDIVDEYINLMTNQ